MKFVIVRTPSLKRYRRIFRGVMRKSILRCLEYERLSTLGLVGRVLDFGGGSRSNYADVISTWGKPNSNYIYESANIDSSVEPTYLLEQGKGIPVASEYFDTVISLNTLEHVYDIHRVIAEIRRVLKPTGKLIFIVPFLFRVHGHPDDYFRATPSYWANFLGEAGFESVEIEAITWGPFSTATMVSGLPGPLKGLRRRIALLLDLLLIGWRYGADVTMRVEQDAPICHSSIGYLVQAIKK